MRIRDGFVEFEQQDMPFVARFGLEEAADMVLDFAQCNRHPFLYDTHQLAEFLHLKRKELFDLTRSCHGLYRKTRIPKHSGGTRTLYVPSLQLRWTQRRILHGILSAFPASPYATAYRPGVTLRDNASPHQGKKYLLKLDFQDFFDSIRFDQVYTAVFNTRRFPRQIGTILTTLCCHRDALPQGAPTSPALSNLVMRHFDDRLGEWCRRHDITYTRYCDDLTFSADVLLYGAYCKVLSLLEGTGLTLNERKTCWCSPANAKRVTGLSVGERITVPTAYKRALRQEVYYLLRYGAVDAVLRGGHTEFSDNGRVQTQSYCRHLLGRVEYVLQIQPELTAFQRYRDQLRELVDCLPWEDEDLPF